MDKTILNLKLSHSSEDDPNPLLENINRDNYSEGRSSIWK